MGAIALVLSRAAPPEPETARRMLRAAPHRGNSLETETLGSAVLGVQNDPEWPFASLARGDGRLAAFCGVLDNADELRARIAREGGPEPVNASPAALLLAGFGLWGEDVARHLRGSHAGAITDGREVRVFRDHFGTRPLFCHDGETGCFVGSEVKQVLAGAPLSREPDFDYIHRVLFGHVQRETPYAGVERLPSAEWTVAGERPGLASRRYWDPTALVETARLDPREAVEGTAEALERAVRRMLSGRDAILLSGGLDSPALAAFAARAPGLERPVEAVTSVYPDHPSADEREWTRMAADHVGMSLHEYAARAGSLDDVERWTELLDGPVPVFSSPESAESYQVARSLGARTVLTGEIAELLFESRGHLLDHLLLRGRLRPVLRVLRQRRGAGRTRRGIVRDLARAVGPTLQPAALRRRRAPAQLRNLPSWVDAAMLVASRSGGDAGSGTGTGTGASAGAASASPAPGRPSAPASRSVPASPSAPARPPRPPAPARPPTPPRDWWIRAQTSALGGPGTGFEADEICATSCGVHVRRPFADVDLWEFVLSLPAELKFPDWTTKPLLRAAVRGRLPDALIDRKDKTYFDEFHLATADYPALRRLLVGTRHRVDGFDYALLAERLEAESMQIYELQWARNVARVHAFLDQW